MRSLSIVLAAILLLISGGWTTDGKSSTDKATAVKLQWKPFTEGFVEAKKSDRKIMVDIYTDWCGWCKRLDRDVFGNEKIAKLLDEHYVVIKLNAETRDTLRYKNKLYAHPEFAKAFGVTGYPTILFFDSDGETITSIGGYLPPEKFLPVIQYIGEDHYKSISWEEYQKDSSKKTDSADKKSETKKKK